MQIWSYALHELEKRSDSDYYVRRVSVFAKMVEGKNRVHGSSFRLLKLTAGYVENTNSFHS